MYRCLMSETKWSRLLEVQRNGLAERTIFGSIAVANDHGVLNRMDSDPEVFGRSLMKPFQMKVVADELNDLLSSEEKSLSLASHNGTPTHVGIAQKILPAEKHRFFALPASLPMAGATPGQEKTIWMNPCSGKHAAILKACEFHRWPMVGYLETGHPYNVGFRELLEETLGVSLETRKVAEDGCLLPTWAMHVSELATAFASLCQTKDDDWIWDAFHSHPLLIGGENRLDSTILSLHENVLAKEGADGLLGLSVVNAKFKNGIGIAIKLAHGYDSFIMSHIAWEILSYLGVSIPRPLAPAGQEVVFGRSVFALKTILT